jgi:hypothetical protein
MKTVFVTGAGASGLYGFPLRVGLTHGVMSWLRQTASVELATQFGFDGREMVRFADALAYSGRRSVDAFLEHRPEYVEIGKLAIAHSLIQREQTESLFGRNDSWLEYLFERLNCPFENFGANEVAFVTFNYDRSLEHYLFTCLRNSYGKSAEECADQLRKIPIVHLHGDLGVLPWQSWKDGPVRDYVPTISADALKAGAARIKIIHEDIAGRDAEFAEAHRLLLDWADQIYFLGFGYNSTNMARLRIAEINKPAQGTGFGLTELERGQIMAATGARISIIGHDCIGLFRNMVRW